MRTPTQISGSKKVRFSENFAYLPYWIDDSMWLPNYTFLERETMLRIEYIIKIFFDYLYDLIETTKIQIQLLC